MNVFTTSRLTSAKARATFDWAPSGASLLEDVRAGSYQDAHATRGGSALRPSSTRPR